MKKLRVIPFVALSILLSQLSCVINDGDESNDQIYPIKTGNTWTYKRTSFVYDQVYLIDTIDWIVGNRMTLGGYTGFSFDNKEITGLLYLVGNDKFGNFITYGCYNNTFSLLNESIRFRLNTKVDDSWFYDGFSWDWYTGTVKTSNQVKCLSTDTLIRTPKENFHCMAFRELLPEGERYSYLSVKIGLVKQVTTYDNGYIIVENLLDFKLH